MTPVSAKRAVLVSMVGVFAAGIIKGIADHKPPAYRFYVATLVAAALLSFLSEPVPQIAGGLAVLALIATLVVNGEAIAGGINSLTGAQVAPPNPSGPEPTNAAAVL